MKLSDIMSHAGLSVFAEVALVLFLVVFVGAAIRIYSPSRRQAMHEASLLPLDDGHVVPGHGIEHGTDSADHSTGHAARGG